MSKPSGSSVVLIVWEPTWGGKARRVEHRMSSRAEACRVARSEYGGMRTKIVGAVKKGHDMASGWMRSSVRGAYDG